MYKKTVLIIDDSTLIREAFSELFHLEGMDVIEAADGHAGINLAQAFLPDVIFCDVTLPSMNGYEVFKSLRDVQQTARIPFFFMSAHPLYDINPVWHESAGFISKPFDFPQIFNKLATVFDK